MSTYQSGNLRDKFSRFTRDFVLAEPYSRYVRTAGIDIQESRRIGSPSFRVYLREPLPQDLVIPDPYEGVRVFTEVSEEFELHKA